MIKITTDYELNIGSDSKFVSFLEEHTATVKI